MMRLIGASLQNRFSAPAEGGSPVGEVACSLHCVCAVGALSVHASELSAAEQVSFLARVATLHLDCIVVWKDSVQSAH